MREYLPDNQLYKLYAMCSIPFNQCVSLDSCPEDRRDIARDVVVSSWIRNLSSTSTRNEIPSVTVVQERTFLRCDENRDEALDEGEIVTCVLDASGMAAELYKRLPRSRWNLWIGYLCILHCNLQFVYCIVNVNLHLQFTLQIGELI